MTSTVTDLLPRVADTRESSAARIRNKVGRWIIYALLITGSLVFIFPIFWMFTTSIKVPMDVVQWPPQWIPNPATWQAYPDSFDLVPFGIWYWNTAKLVVLNIVGTVLSCLIVAYSFARLRFRGRNIFFVILLATMMLPGQVTLIPLYIGFARLGWINTILPLVVPSFFGSAFFIFLMRQFLMTIPLELDEAATIDGCGYAGILFRIIVPLSKPVIGVTAIFTFTSNYNNFMGPLLYLREYEMMTLALGLRQFMIRSDVTQPMLMAMSSLALIPQVVIFFFAQRQMVEGITMTGIKA